MIEARCSIKLAAGGRMTFLTQTFLIPPEVGDKVIVGDLPTLCAVKGRLLSSTESGIIPLFFLRLEEVSSKGENGGTSDVKTMIDHFKGG